MLLYVSYLFLNLFKLVLHVNYKISKLGIVGLTAHGIDFPAHFLRNEIQISALRLIR